MKKILALIVALAMMLTLTAALADVEGTDYTFEAEYTELEGLEGLGVSGSPTGLGLVTENAKANNGYFVGNLGTSSPITFIVVSDADTVATLKIRVGSNVLGSCAWNPTTLKILVNGEAIDYRDRRGREHLPFQSAQRAVHRLYPSDHCRRAGSNRIRSQPRRTGLSQRPFFAVSAPGSAENE